MGGLGRGLGAGFNKHYSVCLYPSTSSFFLLLHQWIDLHSGDYFSEMVQFLRGLLDRIGPGLPEPEQHRVRQVFLRAVQLEVEVRMGSTPAPRHSSHTHAHMGNALTQQRTSPSHTKHRDRWAVF